MITRTDWTGEAIPALGLGTWAIGGPFFAGDDPVGWGETDDAVSLAAIGEGVAAGIRLFDTAQAYGTGHSEALLGRALARHPEVLEGSAEPVPDTPAWAAAAVPGAGRGRQRWAGAPAASSGNRQRP